MATDKRRRLGMADAIIKVWCSFGVQLRKHMFFVGPGGAELSLSGGNSGPGACLAECAYAHPEKRTVQEHECATSQKVKDNVLMVARNFTNV